MMKQMLVPQALLCILITAFLVAPVSAGLVVADGEKITSPYGNASANITITGDDFPDGGTITIDVLNLYLFVNSGTFFDNNIEISSDSVAATWSGVVSGVGGVDQIITLTSSGGNTTAGENITVTFTGANGNPWIPGSIEIYGVDFSIPVTVTRTDTYETADMYFMIETPTPPPGGLTITDGEKITTALGATSSVITIAETDISDGGTITIKVPTELNLFTESGTFTDLNLEVSTDADAATWSGVVSVVRCDSCEGGVDQIITLTSSGGNTTPDESVNVTFTGANGNPWLADSFTAFGDVVMPLTVTRTDTFQTNATNFMINTTPPHGFMVVANFSAMPTADITPLAVTFTDTSLGNATSWNWEFGDGGTSASRNPSHTYTNVGKYTVNLTATNAYGSDTKTRWNYIAALNGAVKQANTSIAGLAIDNCGGPQMITVDTSILPAALVPNSSVLELSPPADRGFNTITIYALDGVGFTWNGNLITGNPTGVHMVSEEIAPSPGFSDQIGAKSSFNYSVDLSSYPCNAILGTKIWEGVIPEFDNNFRKIVDGNNASVVGTAYTATITKTNLPSYSNVRIHMSVDSNWNTYPNLPGAPGMIFIWRISDNETQGQIFPTRYLYTNPGDNLDYYEAESPLGLSTFGISSLTGNNNPFQMITLILSEIISPPQNLPSSDSSITYIPGDVVTQNTSSSTTTSPIPLDPGKTAKIYSNAKGVVTQATVLQSTDGLATVNIGTGIVATDTEGKPLSSITIKVIPPENLPNASPGSSLSFAGRAYELLPDGATFSPGITISFTAPNVQFGQDLMVKMYDHATDTWQDVPSSINPETGIITAHISHFCCFALFAEIVTPESTSAITTPVPIEPKANVPAPTAMSMFMGMILWVADLIQKNAIIFVGIVILAIAIFLYERKRRRDRLMKLT
jgi:PKD repeat protein